MAASILITLVLLREIQRIKEKQQPRRFVTGLLLLMPTLFLDKYFFYDNAMD